MFGGSGYKNARKKGYFLSLHHNTKRCRVWRHLSAGEPSTCCRPETECKTSLERFMCTGQAFIVLQIAIKQLGLFVMLLDLVGHLVSTSGSPTGPSVMMWGSKCGNRLIRPVFFSLLPDKGGGVTVLRYIAQVLRYVVVPFFARRRRYVFQRDNAPAHAARVTQAFLQ